MNASPVKSTSLSKLHLWEKVARKRIPLSFDFEITARCNNNCLHCYINLPAGDKKAIEAELSFNQIKEIVDEAVSLGALWCLLTGGEPLLRKDFADIFLYLKKKGLLISVFTNATLLNREHIRLFKRYPPRDIEVTVYGITQATYERVTRVSGSHATFNAGLNRLLDNHLNVRLKAMALRSNLTEFQKIARFCHEKTGDSFRFDPFLHLRYDGDPQRNQEIIAERLSPAEIVALESEDPRRFQALQKDCGKLPEADLPDDKRDQLFSCGTGIHSFSVSSNGLFRLCPALWHPDCVYDLKVKSLSDAWNHFAPRVRNMRAGRKDFSEQCGRCALINLCMWCPAHAFLETGQLDQPVDHFCRSAHARSDMLNNRP